MCCYSLVQIIVPCAPTKNRIPSPTPPQLFDQQNLPTGDGHFLYVAQYGRPDGAPAVVLHGGPGSGTQPSVLDWFDLNTQRVVLFDQRGAGRSLPQGSLIHNDSPRLVADIEQIRAQLGIARWLVVGGSWGATLALLYARAHAERISGLVLRGSFLASERELHWFFQSLRAMVPSGWAQMTAGWDDAARNAVLQTLAHALLHGDDAEARDAARRWGQYEQAVMEAMAGKLAAPDKATRTPTSAAATPATSSSTSAATTTTASGSAGATNDDAATTRMLGKYRLQAHYLTQQCFCSEAELLHACQRLSSAPAVPVVLVHGTHDLVCPPENALWLQRALPHARLQWVEKGGHTPADPGIAAALKQAIAALR